LYGFLFCDFDRVQNYPAFSLLQKLKLDGHEHTYYIIVCNNSQAGIQNAENYQLLWLDESVNETQDNLVTQKKLRRTFSQLKTFDNVKECEKHVHNVEGTNQKMIMIVSGRFARKLIPPIHDIRELIAFYVYCMNKDSNKQWADNYRKVESYCLQKKFK
jgi:hypothetical protein